MSKSLNFEITFEVPAYVIFNAFVDPMEIMKYTRCKCQVDLKEGGAFEMLEGKIQGTFVSFDKNKSIKQQWKFNEWKEYSTVNISFQNREDSCVVTINQTGIPNNVDTKNLENGWKQHIFKPMSMICGYPIEND